MKKSYLNSERNSAVLLKPSMTIRLFLMVLFVVNSAFSQITQPLGWTKAYDQTTLTANGNSFSVASGTNRILVVGVATTFDDNNGSGTQADPATISYGGVTLSKATGNGTTSGRMHTWLYFLKDNTVMDGTSRSLNVTGGAVQNGRTLANMTVWYAVYAGVDQTPTTYTTGNGFNNNTPIDATAALSALMSVNTNEQAVYISNIYNDNSGTTPSYTINANWTSGGFNTGTNISGGNNPKTIAWKVEVANRTIPVTNTTDQTTTSIINPNNNCIRFAMSGMSLPKVALPPTITSFTPASGCASSTLVVITGTNFTGATAVTFGGTNALSFTVNSATQITATPAAGTTGTIKVTTSGGAATSTGTFTVNASPTIPTSVTSSATTICSGSSINLNATSAGNTIYWYTQATGGISIGNSASGANFTFIPTIASTRYYAEAVSSGGCASSRVQTSTVTLTTPSTITSQPTVPASICSGSAVTMSVVATGTPSYQWRKDGVNLTNSGIYSGTISANFTISNPTISLNGAVFDVVVTRSGCSVISNPVPLTVNPAPVATITGLNGLCIGSTTSLTAATPGGAWLSSNTGRATVDSNGVVIGISAGAVTITYSLTANGCTGTDTHAITVSTAPSPVISFTQGALDDNLNMTACQQVGGGGQNDLDILSGNPNGSTYKWQVSYDNEATWTDASGPTNTQNQYVLDPFYTVFTSNAGIYKFRLLIDNNGCSGVSNLLTLTVSGTSALTAGTIMGNQSSCGQNLNPAGFTSSAAGGGMGAGTYTYQWQSSFDGLNFTNIAGATLTTYDSPQINQTTYFRRSVRSAGCSAFSNVLSVLVGAPVANVSQPNCNSSTGTVIVPYPVSGITYTITGTSPGIATVTNTTGIFSGLTPGDYEVRFIAAAACVSLPTSVTVIEQPLVPYIPVTTTAQPCGISTGMITVTPQNAGETYSFDNGTTFQASNIKSGLAPGNYYVIIKNLVCNSPSKLTVINTSPTTPSTPVITSVIHPNCAVSSGTITVTVQNAGESYSFDNGVTFQNNNIKSGLPSGNYNIIIQSSGGCFSPSTQVTINVQPSVPLTPTVTETVPTCAMQTGTITISGVSGETYSLDGAAFSSNLIYSGLSQASLHSVRAMNAGGCISPTVNISITSLTNTWTPGTWSLGTPNAEQKLIFDGDYSENTDIVGCSCQVNALKDVIITTGHTMTITNEVSVDVDGFLTFEDEASLVQINNATNTGEIDYIRTTDTGIYKTDYVYWSSPVEEFTLGGVSQHRTLSDKYYSYEPTATGEDWQQESTFTIMAPGKGYIIRGPEYSPSVQPGDKYTATFSGVPNNGHYEINGLFADKSYLLGNPYPSALDADTFLANNAAVLNGTLYFWTHNTDMQNRNLILSTAGSGAYAYTSNDYATYNATGGVGIDSGTVTAPAPIGTNPRGDNNANPPSGKIASGQGFFASTKTDLTDSKIVFDNTMRVGVSGITGNNTQFFKTRNLNGKTANIKGIEKNRVWLNLTNAEGAFKQTLVGYLTDATNEYDDRFDGESFDGNEFVDFYSLSQDLNLTIQGRALPFDENDEVPLGFRTTIDGTFTINIAQVDGLLTNQAVFIEDKLTNTVTDLKSGDYKFTTVAGTFNDRFVLKYTNKTLGVDQTDKVDGILAFYSNNYKTLIIKNNLADATVNSVALFNILGQKIENWDVSESEQTNVQIPIKNISSGIYIVKVKTTIGESSKKIIVN